MVVRVGESFKFIVAPFDNRNLPGFDPSKVQLPGQKAAVDFELDTLEEWLKLLFGWDADEPQSIGHDPSNDPQWQDDTTECPPETP